MNAVVIATTSADADAVEAIRGHHAELGGALTTKVGALTRAARDGENVTSARDALVIWADAELLPHARGEEAVLYPAGHGIARTTLLVEAMIAEHSTLAELVDQLRTARDAAQALGAATALQVLFETHLTKENDQLLPVLAEAADVSVAGLLQEMHESLAADEHAAEPSAERQPEHAPAAEGGHACSCGEHDPAGDPELDARVVPHAIRHATIFGALDAVRPGAGLVLIAPHDPLPLLAQIEQREPGAFAVSYLERGPEAWRLRFARRA